MIKDGMSAAIDLDHLAIWPGLYDQLSIEERNCLFFSMKLFVMITNYMYAFKHIFQRALMHSLPADLIT
jgi:hypothetical protein